MRVAIIGAAGYTGAELVRLIHTHPELELVWVGARERAGQRLAEALPNTAGISGVGDLVLAPFDVERASEVTDKADVVFCALPHAASARAVAAVYETGTRVIDLSADFRLRSVSTYADWYGEHPRPELLDHAVYGLVELHRKKLPDAKIIASPGCYPTGAILPLAPLLAEGLIDPGGIIIDAKSGVTGAGRKPGPATHFPEAGEGIRPYKVAGQHRHAPEIEQELGAVAKEDLRVVFTPHLVPMSRGILTSAYATPKGTVTEERLREAATNFYQGAAVTVLEAGRVPDTLWVRGSTRAHLAYAIDQRAGRVLAMSAIDNLARGSSAQAIASLNVAMGWPDSHGLPEVGVFP